MEHQDNDRQPAAREAVEHDPRAQLRRALGLPAAMAIGIGTMVGAGIFVFPGIAAGQAGAGATISFAIGAIIALLVAFPASELATAMPHSGGAYVYVSRSLGSFAGFAVGLAQWSGLAFASAFYLVGFGSYVVEFLEDLGLSPAEPIPLFALSTALVLTGLNATGTRKAGRLQNTVVVTLLLILGFVLTYGLINAFGITGQVQMPSSFAPYGALPIFTTAGLVFTSYLGFVQIATVAGEIKQPSRNLPRAMTGSVLIVGALYVLTLFVCTTVIEPERLAELGETALVDVAYRLLGSGGTVAVLAAGLLATLSSANASILSASRTVFALGKDRILPARAASVNVRFGTPHLALLAAGVPIALLTLLGRIDVLAEAASLLHLLTYGLLCLSLLILRRRQPEWYNPPYRSPGYPVIPVLGMLSSFGLMAFMQPFSLLVGLITMAVIGLLYVLRARYRSEVPAPDDEQA